MEIILKEDVIGLGYKNDIVNVKPGYGRNYLIPTGKGVIASESAKKQLAEDLKQKAVKLAKIKADAEALAQKLNAVSLTIPTKVSSTGVIYGSVNSLQIAEELNKLGFNVDRKIIVVKDVKAVGDYVATVKLHKEVAAEVPFTVIAEDAPVAQKAPVAESAPVVEAPVEEEPAENETLEEGEGGPVLPVAVIVITPPSADAPVEEVPVEEVPVEEAPVEEAPAADPAEEVLEHIEVVLPTASLVPTPQDVEAAEEEAPAAPASFETVALENGIDVRENADGMSAIFTTLPAGTEITVISVEGDWVMVAVGDMIGYVYVDDVKDQLPAAPAAAPVAKKVTIFTSRRTVMKEGEPVVLTSKLEGFEDCEEIEYQWYCDKGDGYSPVAGATEASYSFRASVETLSWAWQLAVSFR